MRIHPGAIALALASISVSGSSAHAGGLFLPGIGPIAQARAGANVASVDDASALGTNPAGLAATDGINVVIGARLLNYSLEFQRNGSYEDIPGHDYAYEGERYPVQQNGARPPIGIGKYQALPMIAIAYSLEKQVKGLRVAAGIMAPTAYPTRDFSSDYEFELGMQEATEAPPPTRYDTVSLEAAILQPSLAASYRINDMFDVGARFTWGISQSKATTYVWGSVNYEENVLKDNQFNVEVKDNFVPTFALGAMAHVTDAIDLGLNWDYGMKVHSKGTSYAIAGFDNWLDPDEPIVVEPKPNPTCGSYGEIGALATCLDITIPMITTVGARYKLLDAAGKEKGDVEFDVAWERWSTASEFKIVVDGNASGIPLQPTFLRHGFQDVFSFRLAGGYQVGKVRLDGGVAHDTKTAKDGWERVDIDGAARTTFGLGVSYPVTPTVDVHVGGGFVYEGTRTNNNPCNPTVGDAGCFGDNTDHPFDERTGPDPAQPLANFPFENPYNAGRYKSSYHQFALAAVMRF